MSYQMRYWLVRKDKLSSADITVEFVHDTSQTKVLIIFGNGLIPSGSLRTSRSKRELGSTPRRQSWFGIIRCRRASRG